MRLDTRSLQKILRPLEATPFHPQWLVLGHRKQTLAWLNRHARGTLVDIGCGNATLREHLPDSVHYIGVDYPATMALGYSGNPHVLADAAKLPFADASVDSILMLDVLEHFADPDRAIAEAARVLRNDGVCLVHVPFLYPLHDEPYDYQRWTRHGLAQLLARHGFKRVEIAESNKALETASALLSIALAMTTFNTLKQRSPLLLLAPLLLALVPVVNSLGWLLGKLLPSSHFMPFSYRVVAST